jgi:hypothetical protein
LSPVVASLAHGGVSGNTGTTVVTSSVSPAAGSLLMMWTAAAKTGGLTVSGISGFATWSKVTSKTVSSSTEMELWTCQCGASPGSGTVTITFSASGSASEGYDLWQVTGHNAGTPLVTSNTQTVAAASGTSPAVTFSTAADTLNRFAFAVCAAGLVTETPGTNYAELTDASYSGPSVSLETQLSADSTDVSATATPSASVNTAGIGVEINAGLGITSLDHNGVDGNAGMTVTTASVSPAANSLLMLWIAEAKTGGITVSSISGFSTWTQVASEVASSSTAIELWTCQPGASPGTGTVTITFSASGSASEGYDLWQVTGQDTTTPLVTGNTKAVAAGGAVNPAITFSSALLTSDRFAFGVVAAGSATETPGSGYTEVTDATYTGPSVSLETQASTSYTSVSASGTPSASALTAAIGVEICAAVKNIAGTAAAVLVRAPGGDAYDTAVLADTPNVYWPDTSGTDATGNGHTLTSYNSPGTTMLPSGDSAYVFNGTSQYCDTPSASDLSVLVTPGAGTYEAWIRPDVTTFPAEESDGYVHWAGKGTTGEYEFAHRMYGLDNTAGRLNRVSGYSFSLSGGLGDGAYWQTPGGETPGAWLHYVLVINYANTSMTWPDGYVTIYRNGVNTNTQTLAGITPGNGTAPLRIGTRDLNSYFEGGIGKYALYGYELSQARVTAHYNAMISGSSGAAGPSGGANVTGVAAQVTITGGAGTPAGSSGSWRFAGPETLIYPSYIDTLAGHTLTAVPGEGYRIQPAGLGDPVCDADNPVPPPDGKWTAG